MVRLLRLNTSIFLTYTLFLIRRKRPFPFKHSAHSLRLDWIGLNWPGLDWIGLDWIGLHNNQATTGIVM
jgi:hypothetical protein